MAHSMMQQTHHFWPWGHSWGRSCRRAATWWCRWQVGLTRRANPSRPACGRRFSERSWQPPWQPCGSGKGDTWGWRTTREEGGRWGAVVRQSGGGSECNRRKVAETDHLVSMHTSDWLKKLCNRYVFAHVAAPASVYTVTPRGSEGPDSHKWVADVGRSPNVAWNVSPTHATDPYLTCRRSLFPGL